MIRLLQYYQNFRPFTDSEAWYLFRLAAFGEAIGWSLLIVGIAWEAYTGSHTLVAVGGRIHGMLFVTYIAAVLAFAPSMRWSFPQTIFGGLMSTPPYGSLVFEKLVSWQRRHSAAQLLFSNTLYRAVSNL